MKLGIITIPFIRTKGHYEMAVDSYNSIENALMKLGSEYETIAVYTDISYKGSKQLVEDYNYHVIKSPENCLGVAWNVGIQKAIELGCDIFYLPNLDILILEDSLLTMLELIKHNPQHGIYAMSAINSFSAYSMFAEINITNSIPVKNHDQSFSSFLMTKKAYLEIGNFIEIFKPAYYEDCDYLYRAKSLGYEPIRYDIPFYHAVNGTRKADDIAQTDFNGYFDTNTQLYIKLHGGLPNSETK